jgi:outer membrane protein TolC
MNGAHYTRWRRSAFLLISLCCGVAVAVAAPPENSDRAASRQEGKNSESLPQPKRIEPLPGDTKTSREIEAGLPQLPPSILPSEANAVDLACVLRLAGVENPEILIARQRVAGAEALQMLAYALTLPNLNAGLNYDAHTGPLQQSSGNILKVNRNALYLGLGANAVAAGTVGIPGIQYIVNLSDGFFNALAIRQNVRARQFDSLAVRNQVFLRVCLAYMNLLRAESTRAITMQNREDAHEVARRMAVYARFGQGSQADADRAAAELARRNDAVVQAEGDMLVRSAELAQLINTPPSIQLHAIDGWVVPTPIVPDPIPLSELLVIAMNQRPELAARRAEIREAILQLRNQQLLPFSPTIIAGYSAGTFGGGSNLVSTPGGFQGFFQPRFDTFGARDDIDVLMFWTAQNIGVGNLARIRERRVNERITELELVRELNRVRNEVATAYAGTHARYAQIGIAMRGVEAGKDSFREDMIRTFTTFRGLPIEVLDSFRLMAEARLAYLDAIVDYDKAQFALYVALGQPPAKYLAHEVPSDLVPPPKLAPPLPGCAPPVGGDGAACTSCRGTP